MAKLERYDLVRRLGQGAAGDVYLAEDRLRSGRRVALKCIRAEVDDLLRAAFEREFVTMASLSLPGIARVFDFGVMPGDGELPAGPFFTRSFIDGSPLDLAAEGKNSTERLRLVARVASVVAPLHKVGVVHGDIKPGNAIIDSDGQAHVIDFGLSRLVGERRRRSEGVGGTPPFMAPEIMRGKPPSVAADIYALGATLWTVLVGEHPFSALGPAALSAKLSGQRPTAPQTLDKVAEAALAMAGRAMEKDPLDRFPSVDEFIIALGEIAPPIQPATASRGFVAPRPRGHEDLLSSLEQSAQTVTSVEPKTGASEVILVQAPSGGGKTTLLRELKWRLQIRGIQVLEMGIGAGDTVEPLLTLLQHAMVLAAEDSEAVSNAGRVAERIRSGPIEDMRASDALAALLAVAGRKAPVMLFVDDLDNAEALVGAVLRSAIHADVGRPVAVIAALADEGAPAAKELQPRRVVRVAPLQERHVAALANDALGSVDVTVVRALCEHTQGLPAALADALAALATHPAPTAADVMELPVGAASLSIAQFRLSAAPRESRELLNALAVAGGSLPEHLVAPVLRSAGDPAPDADRLLTRCEDAALVVRGPGVVSLADRVVHQALLSVLGTSGVRAIAKQLLESVLAETAPLVVRARLALAADDHATVQALAPQAMRDLMARGANSAAADLGQALAARVHGDLARDTWVALAQLRHAMGFHDSAEQLARRVLNDPDSAASQHVEAAITAGQALRALSRLEEAIEVLQSVSELTEGRALALAKRELAKVHLRLGDYDAVAACAHAGLACAPGKDLVRVELLTSLGLVASYHGDHEAARAHYREALELSREVGSKRDQANALASLAVGHQRASEYAAAEDLFGQSLQIARELGDVGSMATFSLNVGAMRFMLADPAGAAEHYEAAARLARRAGRISTDALARNNLALLHIHFGLYESARVELATVLEDAKAASLKYVAAQATGALGDLAAHTGDADAALSHYDDAIARYVQLGQNREVAEAHLDAAEALLDRDGPMDASAAAARLAIARKHIDHERLEDFRLRLKLLLARARLASGDAQAVVGELEAVLEEARGSQDREIEWRTLSVLAVAHEMQGAEFVASRFDRMAVEVLEELALSVPREHRDAFWQDRKRREVRRRAAAVAESTQRGAHSSDLRVASIDTRTERLLEIIKRLAEEHELDRLLERITESAVDLSGAERGLVLLVDESGKLETRTVSSAERGEEDPHVAFSRSIAEAVLIDGEPLISVDATDDRRFNEYLSVHRLMLRSVACIPIRGRSGPVGVLYLEHRRHRSRFSDASVDLLFAFADQAAIALTNARLLRENEHKRRELERVNAELEEARRNVEELLIARTEELEEARRQLSRASHDVRDEYKRYNMVGRSAQMQRVFATIDRLRNTSVPVVIQGESGTGKELVARAIHYGGANPRAPFVSLSCGSLPETLLESELFGHVRGAFTGADRDKPGVIARASGGTLLLDEVEDMPAKMQVDLLRVLQDGVVRPVGGEHDIVVQVRFVAASNAPLEQLVSSGRFRQDLYYRLSVVELRLPALRERRDDIPLLCDYFLSAFARRDDKPPKRLSRDALQRLCRHPLPGNVRQLEHVLLNAWVMTEGTSINASDLALEYPSVPPADVGRSISAVSSRASQMAPEDLPPDDLDGFKTEEKRRILDALRAHAWNKVKAAKSLGMPRRTLYRRLQEYAIE